MRSVVLTALMTGVFCAVFAIAINALTTALTLAQVTLVSAASGTLGSLFAQLILRRHM